MISSWPCDRSCWKSQRNSICCRDMQHECNMSELWSQVTALGGQKRRETAFLLQTFRRSSHLALTAKRQFASPRVTALNPQLYKRVKKQKAFTAWEKRRQSALQMSSYGRVSSYLSQSNRYAHPYWQYSCAACPLSCWRFKTNVRVERKHDFLLLLHFETVAWISDRLFEGWTHQSF